MLQTKEIGKSNSPNVNETRSPRTNVDMGTIGIKTKPNSPVTMRMILFVNIKCLKLFRDVRHNVTHNGSRLCDVVAFKARQFNKPPKLNSNTNVDVR